MSGSANFHSKLSPSGAKQWTTCTASVKYIADNSDLIPPEKESPFAAEGTKAHDLAEKALISIIEEGVSREDALAAIPEDFRDYLAIYIDECLVHITDESEPIIEAVVPLFYRKEDTGTCDFLNIDEKKLVVRDLKYGVGVLVPAEGNEQLAIYAQSAIEDNKDFYDFPDEFPVSIGIVQPRYRGIEPISTWETTVGELREFCDEIGKIAEAIQNNEGLEFSPSVDICKWCKARGICVARAEEARSVLPPLLDPFDDAPQAIPAQTLDNEQLLKVYKNKKFLEKWLKDVEEHVSDLALAGNPIDGTKVVQGRQGNTKWRNDEDAARWLGRSQRLRQSEYLKMDVISPAAAQKLLKGNLKKSQTAKMFDKLTSRADGKKVLALSTDKRPAIETANDVLSDNDPDMEDMLA